MIKGKVWIYFVAILLLTGLAHADVWKQIQPDGTIPNARSGHTLVEINNKIYLYGGESADTSTLVTGNSMLLNDMSIFDPNALVWTPEESANNPPPARKNHSAVALGEKMYILFGEGAQGGLLQDIWVYDPLSKEWQEQVVSSVSKPDARTGHSTVVMYGQIFVYGGKTTTGVVNDLWSLELRSRTWTQRESGGNPVFGHKAIADTGTKMYVHGGMSEDQTMFPDLLSYDLNTKKWENIAVQGGPSARAFHVATFETNKIKISGGRGYDDFGSPTDLGDTWEFDTVAIKWTPKAKVSPHSFSSAVVVPKSSDSNKVEESNVFMFVGQRNGQFLNESWMYYPNENPCDTVKDLAVSPNTLKLKKKESETVTVTATGKNNCPVEGVTVTATVNKSGSKRISVSPSSSVTDENGETTFTITAKNSTGRAVVKFKTGDIKVKGKVTVK